MKNSAPEVSLVIPCLNEAANASGYERTLFSFLDKAAFTSEVIFSDGGSSDATCDIITGIAARRPGVRLLRPSEGSVSFGESLARAARACSGRYVVFMEADLSFSPEDIQRLLGKAKTGGFDCVCGSPFLGSFEGLGPFRLLLTRGANLLLRLRFGRQVTSYTQIFKLFRTSALRWLDIEASGFTADAELTAKCLARGLKVAEVPVTMKARTLGSSKINVLAEVSGCLALIARGVRRPRRRALRDAAPATSCRRRRILLVTPRFPYPSLSGGEKWAASLAGGLSGRHELSLFSFTTPGEEMFQTALALSMEGKTYARVFLQARPEPPRSSTLPALPSLFWSEEAAEALAAAARETGAELVHLLFSEMACFEAALPPRLPVMYTEIDSSYLYPWKYYLRETAGLKGFFKAGEFFRSRAYARRHYRRFSAATSITASDGRDIAGYLSTPRTAVTPNAVNPEEFAPGPGARAPGEVLFLGYYPHYPNEDAALRLARDIFPLLRAEVPGATLTLAGACPTPAVAALAGGGITVPGTVADIRPFLRRAQVFAAPVRYGLGTKGKVLEAFAAGLPVVASPQTAAGIELAVPGRHLLTASGAEEFARQLRRLLAEPELRERLAGEALRLVREEYSFEKVTRTVDSLYGEVLGDGAD